VDGDVDFRPDVPSSDACCELCKSTKHCRFWTFSTPERGRQPNYCWLKNKRVKPYRVTGAQGLVSGYVKRKASAGARQKKSDKTPPQPKVVAKVQDEGKKKKGPSKKKQEKANALVQAAQDLYHKGKSRDAEPLLKQAIEKDESNGAARMWLGFVLEHLGRWQDAIFAYEAALAPGRIKFLRDNDAAMVHNNLGLLYRNKQNRHDDAEAQYRLANAASERAGVGLVCRVPGGSCDTPSGVSSLSLTACRAPPDVPLTLNPQTLHPGP
jgi:tetratricopeptide (TPR) repeat protein